MLLFLYLSIVSQFGNSNNCSLFVTGKSTEISLFCCQKNQLNSAHVYSQKIFSFQLIILATKSTKFSSFLCSFCCPENHLNQLNYLSGKSTEFSLFIQLQNQLISAHFFATKSTEFSSFCCPENHLFSAHFLAIKSTWWSFFLYSFCCLENKLNSAHLRGWKVISFELIFFAPKLEYFISLSWLEY